MNDKIHNCVKKTYLFISSFKNWKMNTLFSKSLQTYLCSVLLIHQFLNDKIYNYIKQNIIVNFIVQILKNKHTFDKKYTNWAKLNPLILTEQEETKTRYFPPIKTVSTIVRPANNRWKFLFSRHRSKTWTDRMLATNPNVPITVILMPWI